MSLGLIMLYFAVIFIDGGSKLKASCEWADVRERVLENSILQHVQVQQVNETICDVLRY